MTDRSVKGGRWATWVAAALLVAACGGGVDDEAHDDDHDEVTIDTAGRLALSEAGSPTLRLHELDAGGSVEATHTLDHVPSSLYASPKGRYVVAMQRPQDQVQFVDGGLWQEPHGDHDDDMRAASRVMPWRLAGVRPTHYDLQAGRQAAIFLDGNGGATPAQAAGVRTLTDAGIGEGRALASLDLAAPLHGLSQPVDDKLLAPVRAADAPDTLPTHLALHLRDGAGYRFVRQLPTRCDGMHGGASTGTTSVVGCLDGLLLVRHPTAATVDDGRKLATPLRVGTVVGHASLPDQYFGIATEGTAPGPLTTRFYAVDGAAGSTTEFVPQGWSTGRVRRAHAFDRSGERFFVLDDQGTLIVSQRRGSLWTPLARVPGVVAAMPAAAPFPVLVANGARDELYLTDPVARQVVVIDSRSGSVSARRDLGYTPALAAWVGIPR